ncbi:hypothetical protein Tco_0729314 [Tanacetum coccineum]|uniref:Uncharacterized protein n=1 Tax=Tanacetum coccineum TaxID=301880 RepID=A0ABQ4YS27_9ASTR
MSAFITNVNLGVHEIVPYNQFNLILIHNTWSITIAAATHSASSVEELATKSLLFYTWPKKQSLTQIKLTTSYCGFPERAAEQEAKDVALIEQMEDNVKSRMNAMNNSQKTSNKKREQFTIEEKSRMFVEMIAERKRFFAAQIAEKIINKPPTRAQLRNKMRQKIEDDAEKEDLRACLDILPAPNKTHIDQLRELFDSCGVHVLLMDTGIAIHMLIKKTYPLTQEMHSNAE